MHNNKDIISGVKCVVNTCHYHHPGDVCSAGTIEIAPRNASSTEETDCNTFTPSDSIK